MTVHVPTKSHPEIESTPYSFLSWLNSQTSLFVGHLLGLFSFGALITSLFYYSLDTGDKLAKFITPLLLQKIIFYAHIPFILFCIIYLLIILDINAIDSKRVIEAYKRIFGENVVSTIALKKSQRLLKAFKIYFLLFWLSMLALYLAFLFIGFLKEREQASRRSATIPSQTVSAKISHANNAEPRQDSAEEARVQVSERVISVEPVEGNVGSSNGSAVSYKQIERFTSTSWKEAFVRLLPEFLPFALNSISLMFVFWCLSILYLPYRTRKQKLHQRRLLYFSALIVSFLIICFPLLFNLSKSDGQFTDQSLLEYTTVFNAISGTLNAVVVALLIARLDSKLIGLPSWLVSILYLYAGVQPLFVVFSQPGLVNEMIKTVVLLFVFILKVYFFLIILYAMQTGRMLNYMFCFPTLNRRVNSMFDNRFQIAIQKKHTHSYDFVITKGRSIVYETDHSFRSRDACMTEIGRLRELMSDKNSYEINPSGNGFAIEVKDKERNKREEVRCTSSDQRSNEEAEALKRESVDYVPYCKLRKVSK